MTVKAKYKRYKGLCKVEPESWVKLLVRIRDRIEIVYTTIIFVSILVGFVIAALSWLWVIAREWALSIQTARTVTWVRTWQWALAQDTMVHVHVHKFCIKFFTHLHKMKKF